MTFWKFSNVKNGQLFKFKEYGCTYRKLDTYRYQLTRHEDGTDVPGMTYNLRERGTDVGVAAIRS